MAERTARRFMDVARVYGPKMEGPSNFKAMAIEVIEELVAPKTPIEVRVVRSKANDGAGIRYVGAGNPFNFCRDFASPDFGRS